MAHPVEKTDAEWREWLSPDEYAVLRKAGTERAFTGKYTDTETKGVDLGKACPRQAVRVGHQVPLRACGWPSFYQPITDTGGIHRGHHSRHEAGRGPLRQLWSHLGHVFPDGYGTPTGDRYCINSISLTLEPADGAEGS